MTDLIPNVGNLGTTAYERLHAEINKANNVTIPALSAEITKTDESINRLQSTLKDLLLGTRNYLLNTGLRDDASSFLGVYGEITRVTTMKTPSGNNCFYLKISNKTSKVWRGVTQEINSGFSIGDTMTFSIQTYVTNEVAADEGLSVEVYGLASDNSTRTFAVSKQVDASKVNKWVKYELTFVVPKNTAKIKCWSYVTKNGSFYTGDYMLEKGNRASDWSPNPTDADNAINTSQNKTSHIKHVSTIEELGTAIDNAVNGDIIYIKQGKYKPNRSYEIPKGVTIKGSGINNCIFDCSSTSINNVFRNKLTGSETGQSTFDIVIEGINFDGVNTIHNITAIAMAHASNVIIRDCMFQRFNSWHIIELSGCQMCYIQRNRFSNYGYTSGGNPTEIIELDFCRDNVNYPWTCNYDNTHCVNIYIEENNFYRIKTTATGAIGTDNYDPNGKYHKNIFVRHNILDTVQSFFHLLGSKRIHIDNNTGENVSTFVTLGSNGYADQVEGTICNNTIGGDIETGSFGGGFTSQEQGRFVYGKDNTDTVSGFTIANNIISNFNGHAIGSTGNGVAITGNRISGTGRNGICLFGGWRYTVTGNTLYDNSRNTTNTFYGIALGDNNYMSLSKSVIACNVCSSSIHKGSNIGISVIETNNIIE